LIKFASGFPSVADVSPFGRWLTHSSLSVAISLTSRKLLRFGSLVCSARLFRVLSVTIDLSIVDVVLSVRSHAYLSFPISLSCTSMGVTNLAFSILSDTELPTSISTDLSELITFILSVVTSITFSSLSIPSTSHVVSSCFRCASLLFRCFSHSVSLLSTSLDLSKLASCFCSAIDTFLSETSHSTSFLSFPFPSVLFSRF